MNEVVQSLLSALREDREAREEVLRALLSDRFLELPERVDALEGTMRELADSQRRTQAQLEALTQRVEALTQRVEALAERMDALTDRVDALAEAQTRTEIAVQTLADRFAKQIPKIDRSIGYVVERTYHERASAYFAPIARRIRVLDRDTLDDLLDAAVEDGTLRDDEARAVRLADTVATGRREDGTLYLVVEASYTVDERDVDRAADRAQLLGRVVREAVGIVAGEYIDESAQRRARELGVYQVLDGTVTGPDGLVLR